MGAYRYKETEIVAHIDCLELQMRVKRFIREKKQIIVSTDPLKKESKMFLIAIECEWFEGKILKKNKFSSKVLVPYHVAVAGKELALAWLNDNFKNFKQ